MSDWSTYMSGQGARGCLSPGGTTPFGTMLAMNGLGMNATATVWTANRVVYLPVVCEKPVTVTDMAIQIGVQAGNCDVGIYEWNGTRLVNSGSTAVAAAGLQVLGIADTALTPGWYYLALWSDSATAAFRCTTMAAVHARVCGLQQQTGVSTNLPTSATFAAYVNAVAPIVIASYNATF